MSADNRFERQLDENESALIDRIGKGGSMFPSQLAIQPNTNDNLAIQQLYGRPVGELLLDSFAPDTVPAFRLALIKVYIKAAEARRLSKATKSQLRSASTALRQLTQAVEKLDRVSPVGQMGLLAAIGHPVDDTKGELELNDFASVCRQIKVLIAPHALTLREAIGTEKAKQTKSGERQKRLRTLVEALADWWQSIGRSLAPTVDANRRDGAPAVVHGRHGDFLQLAVDLFCRVDAFERSEVEAAVTNVHERRLRPAQSGSGA